MQGLRFDDDLYHQETGYLLLALHLGETLQQLPEVPRVHVKQVWMQAVFSVIVFDEPLEKAEHGFRAPAGLPAFPSKGTQSTCQGRYVPSSVRGLSSWVQ